MKPLFHITILSLLLLLAACATKDVDTQLVQFEGESYQKNWAINDLNPELPSDWSQFEYLTFEIKASSTQRFFMNLYDAFLLKAVDGTDGNGAKLVVKYKSPSSATTGGGYGGMTMQSASTLPTTYPSKTGDFTILRATDDATIDLNDGSGRYGLTPTLNVAFNLNTRDVLDFLVKFDISQMRLLPTKAMFTLFAEVDCPNSGTIMVADIDGPHTQEDWSEESVSYETAPTFHLGQPSVERDLDDYSNTAADIGATFGPVTAGKWYGADVVRALTDAIRARKSSVTFRVTTSVNASPCQYSSRESGRAPKLMVEF